MKTNIKFDEYDNIELDKNGIVLSSEFIMDGAKTLTEAADMLREYADYLEELKDGGYGLTNTVTQGRGFAILHSDFESEDDSIF